MDHLRNRSYLMTGASFTPYIGAGGGNGNDAFTKSLLHFDGSNGGTVFTDSNLGGATKTWSQIGTGTTSTTQIKFGTTSLSAPAGGGCQTASSTDWQPGSSDFTFDFWVWKAGGNGTQMFMMGKSNSAASLLDFGIKCLATNLIQCSVSTDGSTFTQVNGTTSYTATGWNHIAYVRFGNVLKFFFNGTQEGGDVAFSSSVFAGTNAMAIGGLGEFSVPNGQWWNGFIDEFRYTKGLARWTANFTVPAAPYGN
jgi:hypothetical protein